MDMHNKKSFISPSSYIRWDDMFYNPTGVLEFLISVFEDNMPSWKWNWVSVRYVGWSDTILFSFPT